MRAFRTLLRADLLLGVCLLSAALPAAAHQGPPYPILVDQRNGPYTLSVWADPDVGTGTFYVTIEGDPAPDTAVEVWVQPEDRRLPEVKAVAKRQPERNPARFIAEAHFETQEWWRTRLVASGSAGSGEWVTRVKVTPPGLGPWDIALYLAPFLAVGFLWIKAMFRKRQA